MPIDRREFLRRAALLGAASTLPTLAAACSDDASTGAAPGGSGGMGAGGSGAGGMGGSGGVGGVAGNGGMPMMPTKPDDLPTYMYDGPMGPESIFEHSVASGDPLTDSVVLWTRVSVPETTDVEVFVEVALDPAFQMRCSAGTYTAKADEDHTLRLDATGLQPGTTHYFRFFAQGRVSPIGRTRTAPVGAVDRLRFGVASCSNFAHGYFYAYRHMAARPDLDAFIHLGDYIYEYANRGFGRTYGTFREHEPDTEMVSLSDYRLRYGSYRRDPDLAELHRQNPVIHVWDDHEFTNDPLIGGAENHEPASEGDWDTRVMNAVQAYREWMPTRLGDGGRIFRQLAYGDLVNLIMLDRQRRYIWPEADDGTLYLGKEQADWLDARIAETTATWLLFGQGTDFIGRDAFLIGGWDEVSRRRVYTAMDNAGVKNLVVLTGDIHRAEALDIVRDAASYQPGTGIGSAGVELSSNSITSPAGPREALADHFLWSDDAWRGYLVIDFTPQALQGDFFGFPKGDRRADSDPGEQHQASFRCMVNTNYLTRVQTPLSDRPNPPALAP